MTTMTPRELFDQVDGTWWNDGAAQALALVTERWPEIAARPTLTAEDGEVCRQAYLAAKRLGFHEDALLWKVRALSRFAAVGWGVGAAAILMTEVHRLLARANDDYAAGKTLDLLQPSPHAAEVLEELRPFTGADAADPRFDFGPTPTLIARFYHERRGILATIEGRYSDAEEAYAVAADAAANEPRGAIKVDGNRALAQYLAALDAGSEIEAQQERTRRVLSIATERELDDLAAWASHNVAAMERRSRAVLLYEML